MQLTTQIRSPFRVTTLPLIGRLYRSAFRSGSKTTPALVRFLARMAFYILRGFSVFSSKGVLSVRVGNEDRDAEFNAWNRQFNAIYFEKYSSGYEPEVTTLIESLVHDDGVFYDVGSNWGFFTIYLASRPNFSGRIHAFEPWPPSFSDISKLTDDLRLTEVVSCHNLALSDEVGVAFMRSPSHSGLAHLSSSNGTKVQITCLDELELDPPSLIKIDAEGAEDKILMGGKKFLSKNTPMLIFENRVNMFGNKKCTTVLNMLESIDYKLFVIRMKNNNGTMNTVELLPITSETRSQYGDCDNLFACHSLDIQKLNHIASH